MEDYLHLATSQPVGYPSQPVALSRYGMTYLHAILRQTLTESQSEVRQSSVNTTIAYLDALNEQSFINKESLPAQRYDILNEFVY